MSTPPFYSQIMSIFAFVAYERGQEDAVMHLIADDGPHYKAAYTQYAEATRSGLEVEKYYWQGYCGTLLTNALSDNDYCLTH